MELEVNDLDSLRTPKLTKRRTVRKACIRERKEVKQRPTRFSWSLNQVSAGDKSFGSAQNVGYGERVLRFAVETADQWRSPAPIVNSHGKQSPHYSDIVTRLLMSRL